VFGNVTYDSNEEAMAVDQHFTHGEVCGKRATILACSDHRAVDSDGLALTTAQVLRQKIVVLVPPRRRHEYFDVLSNHLLRTVPEQPFGSGVQRLDNPLPSIVMMP
jgi:hypothetical protein